MTNEDLETRGYEDEADAVSAKPEAMVSSSAEGAAVAQDSVHPNPSSQDQPKPRLGYMAMLVILYAGAFIAAFNENIINTGLVDIMSEFSVDSITAQWLVTGYMIVTAVVVTFVGFLLKRFSVRAVFSTASIILLIGSIGCIFAPNFAVLLIARLFASVGTGLFIPTMMNSVLVISPRHKLGTFLSIGGCMITFGPALAPVASGFMVTMFGWRTMFLIPTVAVAVILVAGLFILKPIAEPEKLHLDGFSVVLSAVGLTVFVYGLGIITTNLPLAIVTIVIGLAVIALFVRRQNRIANPLLDLRPMRNSRFWPACILVVVSMMTTFSMSVLLPMYFEGASGTTAFVAGALILIPILVNALTSLIGGRVMDKRGEWPLLPVGFGLILVGQVIVCIVGRSAAIGPVVAASVLVYAGVGLVMSPGQTAGLKHLTPDLNPYGVAIMSTFIQVAACLGPSLFVGVLSSISASAAAEGAASNMAQAAGFSDAVLVAAAIAAAGFVIALFYSRSSAKAGAAVAAGTSAAPAAGGAEVGASKSEGAAGAAGAPGATAAGKATAGAGGDVAAAPSGAAAATGASGSEAAVPAPTLASIMKTDVYQVSVTATVHDAVSLMLEKHTSGLPITDGQGNVLGFISDGDIMKSLGRQGQTAVDLVGALAIYQDDETFEQRVASIMESNVMDYATRQVISISVGSSIEEACTLLGERRLKKVPVLENGKLVGTISRTDVNRYLMNTFVKVA